MWQKCSQKDNTNADFVADIHCHILPGVDDGAGSIGEALDMLRIAEAEGITHMILTPHYKNSRRRASNHTVVERYLELCEKASAEGIDIVLSLGSELLYFEEADERLEGGKIFTLNDSKYVLVEFSPQEQFSHIKNALCDIMNRGYIPVLAHIERYECMYSHGGFASHLKSMGVKIQVNSSSVTGEVGGKIKRYTAALLKEGLVDYIGTDAHSTGKRAPRMKRCRQLLNKKYGQEYARELLFENARRDFALEYTALKGECDAG